MSAFYLQIKFVHVFCVVLSGTLFCLRGAMMLKGSRLGDHPLLRYASYGIDTTLLAAAMMLVAILHQYPFVQSWLTAKVLLLTLYIVLGVFALHRGRTRTIRAGFFAAALLVYAFIVSVAIAHDPRGWFAKVGVAGPDAPGQMTPASRRRIASFTVGAGVPARYRA